MRDFNGKRHRTNRAAFRMNVGSAELGIEHSTEKKAWQRRQSIQSHL